MVIFFVVAAVGLMVSVFALFGSIMLGAFRGDFDE